MMKLIRLFTHRFPTELSEALDLIVAEAKLAGYKLCVDRNEAQKHPERCQRGDFLVLDEPSDVSVCFALGGDGTILAALRACARHHTPVFGVNFGEIGFLAAIEREELSPTTVKQAFHCEFEQLDLPAIALHLNTKTTLAVNDISVHRKVGERVASLRYAVEKQELGRVRCDGLVAATPAGSTGYTLANGGPLLAWGVEGYVVSFIAPHSLTARPLVIAPDDTLTVSNSSEEPLDVTIDGRPAGELTGNAQLEIRFLRSATTLARIPGSTFYRSLHEKFGRLA